MSIFQLRQVREEVAGMLSDLDAALPPRAPARIDRHHREGPLRYWYEGRPLSVHTSHHPDELDAVYLTNGAPFGWSPHDWVAVTTTEARLLGAALLAAAADAHATPRTTHGGPATDGEAK